MQLPSSINEKLRLDCARVLIHNFIAGGVKYMRQRPSERLFLSTEIQSLNLEKIGGGLILTV